MQPATMTIKLNLVKMQPEAHQWKNGNILRTLFLLLINYSKSS